MGFGIGIYALIVLREGLSFTLEVRTWPAENVGSFIMPARAKAALTD